MAGWFFAMLGLEMRKLNKRVIIPLVATLLFSLFLGFSFLRGKTNYLRYELESRLSFSYPSEWEEVNLSTIGLEKHLAARLIRQDPKANFDISFKEGATTVDYEDITSSVKDSLLKNYNDFTEVSRKDTTIGEKRAFEFVYTYSYATESGVDKVSKQRMVLVQNANTMYYLIFQCEEKDFSNLEKEFGKILNSLEFK